MFIMNDNRKLKSRNVDHSSPPMELNDPLNEFNEKRWNSHIIHQILQNEWPLT